MLALALGMLVAPAGADTLQVAVASNFRSAMEAVTERWTHETGHRLVVSYASTGKHYAQIVNGAPFDAFFAADAERPALLESHGLALSGSRFTYAEGKLVLWSPVAGRVDPDGAVLEGAGFRFLALAQPDLAPYGRAARETLQALGRWDALQDRLVRGENVAQAFQYVASGAADLGFVAAAQLTGRDGSSWVVPAELYRPIEQQAVVLKDGVATRSLMAFLCRAETRELLRAHGYGVP